MRRQYWTHFISSPSYFLLSSPKQPDCTKELPFIYFPARLYTKCEQKLSVKDPAVNILGFKGHSISAIATQLCHYSTRAAIDTQSMSGSLRGSVGWGSHFGSGHDLSLWLLPPHRAFCWQLRAWSLLQILCLPLSLSAPPLLLLCLSLYLSKINKH